MENIVKSIKESYESIVASYSIGRKAIKEFVKAKGGFISFVDDGEVGSVIIGYDIVWDNTHEMRLWGIRVDEYDNIEVYGTPYDGFGINTDDWNWEEHMNDDYDSYLADSFHKGYWFNIEDGLPVFTIYWLLESILDYCEN